MPCPDSSCNTPIFPVKKAPPSKDWRMVLDLQAVNSTVILWGPLVPDLYTLLNDLQPQEKLCSVIAISKAYVDGKMMTRMPQDVLWLQVTKSYKQENYHLISRYKLQK